MRSPLLHPKFKYKRWRPSTTQGQARVSLKNNRNQKKIPNLRERQSRGCDKQLKRSNPKTGTLTLKGRVILTIDIDKQLVLNFDPRPALHLFAPWQRIPAESSSKKITHRKSTNFFRRRRHWPRPGNSRRRWRSSLLSRSKQEMCVPPNPHEISYAMCIYICVCFRALTSSQQRDSYKPLSSSSTMREIMRNSTRV